MWQDRTIFMTEDVASISEHLSLMNVIYVRPPTRINRDQAHTNRLPCFRQYDPDPDEEKTSAEVWSSMVVVRGCAVVLRRTFS